MARARGKGGLRNLNYLKLYEATKKTQKVEKRGIVLRKAQLLYEKHDYNVCKRYFWKTFLTPPPPPFLRPFC